MGREFALLVLDKNADSGQLAGCSYNYLADKYGDN